MKKKLIAGVIVFLLGIAGISGAAGEGFAFVLFCLAFIFTGALLIFSHFAPGKLKEFIRGLFRKKSKSAPDPVAPSAAPIPKPTITSHGDSISFSIPASEFAKSASSPALIQGDKLDDFIKDFCVIDLETTGLSPSEDRIIEVSALRVRSGDVVDTYTTLINPGRSISHKITEITGLTDADLADAPAFSDVCSAVRDFLGDDPLVGHNIAKFDVPFLAYEYDRCDSGPIRNDYIDTLEISKRLVKNVGNYKLPTVAAALGVTPDGSHRALSDCYTTYQCAVGLSHLAVQQYYMTHHPANIDFRTLATEKTSFDEASPVFGKTFVCTGDFEKISLLDAAQAVLDLGGHVDNNVTKRTHILVTGDFPVQPIKGVYKSNKRKQADDKIAGGQAIDIITEDQLLGMIGR